MMRESSTKNSYANSAIFLLICTAVSKAFGFIREVVQAYIYGATTTSDAIVMASSITGIISIGVTASLLTIYIPIGTKEKGQDRLNYFTSNLINISFIIVLILSVLSMVFIKPMTSLLAIGFNQEAYDLTVYLSLIMLPATAFTCITYIISGYLQLNRKFLAIGIQSLMINIITVITLIVTKWEFLYLGIGLNLSLIMPSLALLFYAKKNGYKYSFVINIKDSTISSAVNMSIPIIIGQIAIQASALIDRAFASTLAEGVVSALKYANILCTFAIALFITSITTVIFPSLSEYAEDNMNKLREMACKALNVATIIILPVIACSVILGEKIIKLLFMRGAFDNQALIITSNSFRIYSLGLFGLAICEVLNKVFYSLKDTKTPVIRYVIAMIINIILNAAFIRSFGYMGLAWATTISSTALCILQILALHKKVGGIGMISILTTNIKALISAIIMAISMMCSASFISLITPSTQIGLLIIITFTTIIGLFVYLGINSVLKVKEVNTITHIFKSKLYNMFLR